MSSPCIAIRADRLRLMLDHLYAHDIKNLLEALMNRAIDGMEPTREEMSSEAYILYTVIVHDMDDVKMSEEA